MKNTFLAALENVRTASPANIVEKVLDMFTKISNMNMEEIIATHQTFWFFRRRMDNLSEDESDQLDEVGNAILNRMVAVCAEPEDRNERARRAAVLGRVAGGGVYCDVIGRSVDGFVPRPLPHRR